MRHPRPFALFLAAGALCSAAGLAATRMSAGAIEVEQPAPRISAFEPASTVLSNAVPTVVTQASPAAIPALSPVSQPPAPTPSPELPAPTPQVTDQGSRPAFTPTPTTAAPAASVESLPSSIEQPADVLAAADKAAALLVAMNAARAAEGLPPFEPDAALEEVAYTRARNLVLGGYFDHYGPDGESAFSELAARGIVYALAGENLARNNYPEARTVAAAFDGLMASPGHRANILEPRFARAGVAAVRDGRIWLYVTVFMD